MVVGPIPWYKLESAMQVNLFTICEDVLHLDHMWCQTWELYFLPNFCYMKDWPVLTYMHTSLLFWGGDYYNVSKAWQTAFTHSFTSTPWSTIYMLAGSTACYIVPTPSIANFLTAYLQKHFIKTKLAKEFTCSLKLFSTKCPSMDDCKCEGVSVINELIWDNWVKGDVKLLT